MRLPWRPITVYCGQQGGVEVLTSLTAAETDRLVELAERHDVLEVGSAYGYSTIVMASVARSVVSIDPHAGELENSFDVMSENLDAAGVAPRVQMYVAFSQDVLPGLIENGFSYDLVFVDGDHSYDACLADIRSGWRLLRPGGALAVHDYGESNCREVRRAVDAWWPEASEPTWALTDTLWEAHRS